MNFSPAIHRLVAVGVLAGFAQFPAGREKFTLKFCPVQGTRLTYGLAVGIHVEGKGPLGSDLALEAATSPSTRIPGAKSGCLPKPPIRPGRART